MNSIGDRIGKLCLFLAENLSYDIFELSESWLSPIVDDSFIKVKRYTLLRQDKNINGGGVCLYVRNEYEITKLKSSDTLLPVNPDIPEYFYCSVQHVNFPPVLVEVIFIDPQEFPCKRH